jgi:hypothetical protein
VFLLCEAALPHTCEHVNSSMSKSKVSCPWLQPTNRAHEGLYTACQHLLSPPGQPVQPGTCRFFNLVFDSLRGQRSEPWPENSPGSPVRGAPVFTPITDTAALGVSRGRTKAGHDGLSKSAAASNPSRVGHGHQFAGMMSGRREGRLLKQRWVPPNLHIPLKPRRHRRPPEERAAAVNTKRGSSGQPSPRLGLQVSDLLPEGRQAGLHLDSPVPPHGSPAQDDISWLEAAQAGGEDRAHAKAWQSEDAAPGRLPCNHSGTDSKLAEKSSTRYLTGQPLPLPGTSACLSTGLVVGPEQHKEHVERLQQASRKHVLRNNATVRRARAAEEGRQRATRSGHPSQGRLGPGMDSEKPSVGSASDNAQVIGRPEGASPALNSGEVQRLNMFVRPCWLAAIHAQKCQPPGIQYSICHHRRVRHVSVVFQV